MIPSTGVLERGTAVLVIVDVQERLAAAMERRAQVLRGAILLLSVARITGVPVVVTRQYPKGLGAVEPQLQAAFDQAAADGAGITAIDKVTFDCFGTPEFVDAVCEGSRKQMVLVGMETHICVTQTALAGLREGFDVHVVADACCSRQDENHYAALARLGNAGAVLTTAESAAYELIERAGTDEFRELLAAVKAADASDVDARG